MKKKQRKYRGLQAARMSRKLMTQTESLLWKYLQGRRLCGVKFRRQHPVNGFVLDFYCPERQLAIELDGGIHSKQKEYDSQRQSILEACGISFLRFNNTEVSENIENVLRKIKRSTFPLREVERDVRRTG